jgi:formylglycine-generating enzyme required for sulfatase activity
MPDTVRRLLLPILLAALCAAVTVWPEAGPAAPAPLVTNKLTNSIGMKMVRIPAGTFTMGSPLSEAGRDNSEAQHEVEITRSFFLGIYHVTQGEYEKVVGRNPSHFCPTGGGAAVLKGLDWRTLPVEHVSWDDAVAFCKKLSAMPGERAARRVYRLPTEAEWEYACRGGAKAPLAYHYGDKLAMNQANVSGAGVNRTSKVGSYKPNAWGLYDMHGNVWQMCHDYYDANYYRVSPKKDPTGPKAGTNWVARGGSWLNGPSQCRTAFRAWVSPNQRNNIVGFRVICHIGGR